jgi:hypothetical protein
MTLNKKQQKAENNTDGACVIIINVRKIARL